MSTVNLELMHLVHLGSLLRDRPYELGPMPSEVPDDLRPLVITHLADAHLTSHTGAELTPAAHALLAPLVDYDAAFWGMLTLHNMRQPVKYDVDDRWIEHLRASLTTAAVAGPRVYFMMAYRDGLMTTAIRNNTTITIAQYLTDRPRFPAAAAQFLLRLGNPTNTWKPMQERSVSLPYSALDAETVPVRGPVSDADPHLRQQYATQTRRWAQSLAHTHKLDPRTIDTVTRMLSWDHVAAMQVLYSHGPERKTPRRAVTVDYFYNVGVAVSAPRQLADGSYWRSITPATDTAVHDALTRLAALPAEPRDYLVTATANNPDSQTAINNAIPAEYRAQAEAFLDKHTIS